MIATGYAVLFVMALVPGLPVGVAVFGRRHLAAWGGGAVLGYVITTLALWVVIQGRSAGVPGFLAAWALAVGIGLALARLLDGASIPLPRWTRRDTAAWALVIVLTALVAIPPFTRVGASDAEGNRYYRAYFTADFAWHTALTAELAKFSTPPRNPYLANRPLHYYWTYFLLPASVAGAAPRPMQDDIETLLKVNAIGTAFLFVTAIFIAVWAAVPRAWPVAASVALAIVASSAEGAYALWRLWRSGASLTSVRDLNIDALSNWWFHAPRIDGLQRCFWWVPQHSMAYALGLIALAVVNAAGAAASPGAILVAGLALAGATMMNPFVGGIFTLAWGLAVILNGWRGPGAALRLARHAVAAVPILLAIWWCDQNRMVEGAGGALQLGWLSQARNAPLPGLLLSLGPALAPAVVGVVARSRERLSAAAVCLATLSIAALYLLRLRVDLSWVGFRAGQMVLVAVPALTARGLAACGAWRPAAVAIALAILAAGAPTTAIDAYNAQDISNFSASPNGPWTLTVTRAEQDALEWLRRTTSPGAIVQMDPQARDRKTWSLLPSLAQRRMAAGLPISLLDVPEYHDKSAMVSRMYETTDAVEAWDIATRLRIEYIYIDGVERGAHPAGMAKFAEAPERFAPAFGNDEVTIYRVY